MLSIFNSFSFNLLGLSPKVGAWGNFLEMIKAPEDISTNGHLIMWLFNYTTIMNIFYFVLVCVGLFGFSYLYYHKRHPKAEYTYGNKKIHLWVTAGIGLAVFLSIDMTITSLSNNDLLNNFWKWPDPKKEKVVRVEVLAQQWAWHFRYPGSNGFFQSPDDVVVTNELVIPKGHKLLIHMTSKDVIHSLYFPNARIKVDAMPGRVSRMWFEPTKTGHYDIACAEMCGTYHYLMAAKLRVVEEDEYNEWLSSGRQLALSTNDPENPDLNWGWAWESRK